MRSSHASFTAQVVALCRALVAPKGSVARAILPRPGRAAVALLDAAGAPQRLPRRAREFVQHIALRAAILDAEIAASVSGKVGRASRQVVILGAGLDTRAHALDALAAADVFEVDHPSSQAVKLENARGMPRKARSLRYVSIDFERQALAERLAASGYAASEPSVFVLEGVVPYLTRDAIRKTLAEIRACAAPSSRLLLTYVPEGIDWIERVRMLTDLGLRVAGEPMRSPLTPAEMHALVEEAGLSVESDREPAAWADALGAAPADDTPPIERLLIARKA